MPALKSQRNKTETKTNEIDAQSRKSFHFHFDLLEFAVERYEYIGWDTFIYTYTTQARINSKIDSLHFHFAGTASTASSD